jgi:hypothetical protein
MNERIQELAKQAGYYQEQDVDGSRFDAMPRQCFEKFAELIVRECKSAMYKEFAEGKFMTLEGCYHAINEHFGVKE